MRIASSIVIGVCVLASFGMPSRAEPPKDDAVEALFRRDNLIAWCIVPFDSKNRTPEVCAVMLKKLGFKHFAYDWRGEHVPTFDAEVDALKKQGVALDAWWVAPGELNPMSRQILDVLKRHGVKAQLWVLLDFGADKASGAEQSRRVEAASSKLKPLAEEAGKIGCTLGLYNHGGWFGEPENQVAIIERLKKEGVTNVGMVYNLHHGHDHLDRFAAVLQQIKPYLYALNLNGTDRGGDKYGRKILPLGQGELDLELLKAIVASGYRGPIGILGHTQDDAEARLQDNLDGLDWLVPQLRGHAPGPKPTPRTPVPPRPANAPKADAKSYDPALVTKWLADAREHGDARRGADVFGSPKLACISCHKVGKQGGVVGPDLTAVGVCTPADQIVESILWPQRKVKEGYEALAVSTTDGRIVRGYRLEDDKKAIILREVATGERVRLPNEDIEEVKPEGSLMPEGATSALSASEMRDLVRFLLDLGGPAAFRSTR